MSVDIIHAPGERRYWSFQVCSICYLLEPVRFNLSYSTQILKHTGTTNSLCSKTSQELKAFRAHTYVFLYFDQCLHFLS